ncbi:MAG: Gfo/Idh/MocA family oxidoreductase [Candidatus Neomarinimicrobiota bacterium]
MRRNKRYSRRSFLRKFAAMSAIGIGAVPAVLNSKVFGISPRKTTPVSPNDRIRIATIGMGIIGFVDTKTALLVPGVEFVAAADLYDGRLVHTKEVFGDDVITTRDYEEILARPDIDVVILSTPDHWHAKLSIAAMKAGKHVYCEKPMIQHLEDGPRVIKVSGQTKRIFQVGSQYVSSIIYDKAKELYESGAIGKLNMIEAVYNRNSSIGAWQYSIPPDASPETIDWDRFLGDAPKRQFDAMRFFRWRNYWDYGTGVAGDLYVHLFSGIHHVLTSKGPNQIVTKGGLRFWIDGRDVPDVMLGLLEYPETDNHPAFTLSLQTNFADGSGGGSHFRFVGSDGVMTIDWEGVSVSRNPRRRPSEEEVIDGYNSVRTFSEATQEKFAREYREKYPTPERLDMGERREYKAPEGYDDRYDHFANFFNSIRNGDPVEEDASFGYRAAAPAVICNMSYLDNRIYEWDPDKMKLKS